MEGSGFEPPNPKERIYSPPRLARLRYPSMVARDGIEPTRAGATIRCVNHFATIAIANILYNNTTSNFTCK